MVLIVNYQDMIHTGCDSNKSSVYLNQGNELHILDTDDLCVETVSVNNIPVILQSGVYIDNLLKHVNDRLLVVNAFPFTLRSKISCMNGLIDFVASNTLSFAGEKKSFRYEETDTGFRVYFGNTLLCRYNVYISDFAGACIAYMYRAGEYLVIQEVLPYTYAISGEFGVITTTTITTLNGQVVGVVPYTIVGVDDIVFDIFRAKDLGFMSKFITMQSRRY